MQRWIENTADRGEVLVRTGRGVVTAVVDLGDGEGPGAWLRIEIDCERPPDRPRAVRYRVHPRISQDDPLAERAWQALRQGVPVEWTVRWVRHDWIPAELPIASLDLATDAMAVLAGLAVGVRAEAGADPDWAWIGADDSSRAEETDSP